MYIVYTIGIISICEVFCSMTLLQMRYFAEICKWGTISKAAEELFISQPALSGAMKYLEKQLGINIFRRSGRKILLTAEGEFLLAKTTPIIKEIDALLTSVSDLSQNKNHIRLAMPLLTGSYLIPIILGEFKKTHPNILIEMAEVGGIEALKMIENDDLELAIVNYEAADNDNLNYTQLFTSSVYFCVHKEHPLAKQRCISLASVCNYPLVLFHDGFMITRLLDAAFIQANIQPNVILRTSQLHTIKSLVENNLATAFLTKEAVGKNPHIVTIPLKKTLSFHNGIVTKKGKHIYNDSKELISFIINKFKR